MILGAFGDSFLYGCDLKDCDDNEYHSNQTWPALIAKHFSLDYHCYADPGTGNRLILNSIIKAISQYTNNMIYCINWSYIDRFDYVDSDSDSWYTTRPSGNIYIQPEKNKAYYKYLHSELLDKNMSLVHIYSAIQLLKQHKCKFIMTYMDQLILDTKWHAPTEIQFLQDQVNSHLKDFDGMNFLDWARNNKFEISDKNHPLEVAHKTAFKYWLPAYEKLLLSSPI